jgi:hypothetical protein
VADEAAKEREREWEWKRKREREREIPSRENGANVVGVTPRSL